VKPQSAEVLHLLRASGLNGVTQQDAIRFCQCYRLAARISDLRAEGYVIVTQYETRGDRRFARYRLNDEPEQVTLFFADAV